METSDQIRKYLADIGRCGGKRSRRKLSSEQARDMVRIREARRAFREFYAQCFWYMPADLEEAVALCAEADAVVLKDAGYDFEWVLRKGRMWGQGQMALTKGR